MKLLSFCCSCSITISVLAGHVTPAVAGEIFLDVTIIDIFGAGQSETIGPGFFAVIDDTFQSGGQNFTVAARIDNQASAGTATVASDPLQGTVSWTLNNAPSGDSASTTLAVVPDGGYDLTGSGVIVMAVTFDGMPIGLFNLDAKIIDQDFNQFSAALVQDPSNALRALAIFDLENDAPALDDSRVAFFQFDADLVSASDAMVAITSFEITSSAIPEPGTLTLAMTGLLAGLFFSWRRRGRAS